MSKESSIPGKMKCIGKQVNGLRNRCEAFNSQFASVFVRDELVLGGPKTSETFFCLDDIIFLKSEFLEAINEIKLGSDS